jgi:hypothetical protein
MSKAILRSAVALALQTFLLGSVFAQEGIAPVCPNPTTHKLSEDGKTCLPKADSEKPPQIDKEAAPASLSEPGNYVHDCIKPLGSLKRRLTKDGFGTEGGTTGSKEKLYVAFQDGAKLGVLPADNGPIFGCKPIDGEQTSVTVDEVVSSGSFRSGWVYGMLVAPFKFYPYSGEIAASATVGPYLGWRIDRSNFLGISTTWVLSGGISSVTAKYKDEAGQAKSAQLTAWSGATGFIFDINKGKNPFRAGVLVGKDWVDRKSSVTYENNAHTWFALQLGYDWTDR